MANLYLTEQGSSLKKTGQKIVIEKEGNCLGEVAIHRLDSILVCGNIQCSTQSLRLLLRKGISLSLLSMKGQLYGSLTPVISKNVDLRLAQYELFRNVSACLEHSKTLVKAKLHNSKELLKQLSWNNTELDFSEHVNRIDRFAGKADNAQTLSELHGLEGSSARVYFHAYRQAFKNKALFNGRSKRPPADPGNAVLSFGYVLLTSMILSHLNASGFDPYLGFYHRASYGKPTLAFDLLEILRAPVVDRFALRAFNLGILKKEHFAAGTENDWMLTDRGLKVFFEAWDRHLRKAALIDILNYQIGALRKMFLNPGHPPEYYKFKAL